MLSRVKHSCAHKDGRLNRERTPHRAQRPRGWLAGHHRRAGRALAGRAVSGPGVRGGWLAVVGRGWCPGQSRRRRPHGRRRGGRGTPVLDEQVRRPGLGLQPSAGGGGACRADGADLIAVGQAGPPNCPPRAPNCNTPALGLCQHVSPCAGLLTSESWVMTRSPRRG